MKAVLDTNALISSTIWEGSANKTLQLLISKDAKLYTSKSILDEYEKVIRRDFPQLIDRLPGLMERIVSFSILAEPSMKLDVVKEDPDDNRIIECAVASKAEYIVTYDIHLLKLKEYCGVKIMAPESMRGLLEASKDMARSNL